MARLDFEISGQAFKKEESRFVVLKQKNQNPDYVNARFVENNTEYRVQRAFLKWEDPLEQRK